MTDFYKIIRVVTVTECPWLERDFAIGDIVCSFDGCTYGVISSSGKAFTEKQGGPFFELPCNSIELCNCGY